MDAKTRKTIEDAYELLKDENNFLKYRQAAGPNGEFVICNSESAERWCAKGAIAKVNNHSVWNRTSLDDSKPIEILNRKAIEIFPEVYRRDGSFPIVLVNNKLGHAALMQVFEKVLAEDGGLPI